MMRIEGGLRIKGLFNKKFASGKPLVSIITVCYNAAEHLEQTILSVIDQTYDNVEYIIVDGGSKDRTLEIIRKYEDKIAYWISESDNGIYDAMNKGLGFCSGEVVYFLNADDHLYQDNVVKTIADTFYNNPSAEIVYGKVLAFNPEDGFRIAVGQKTTLEHIKNGVMPNHQSIFMKKDVILECGLFNTEYRTAADFELVTKCFSRGCGDVYIDTIVSLFRLTGISSNNTSGFPAIKDRREIIKKHFNLPTYLKYLIRSQLIIWRLSLISKLGLMRYWNKFKMMIYR